MKLVFDILDDLSDELELDDFYQFVQINKLTFGLTYKVVRKVEYYVTISRNFPYESINPLPLKRRHVELHYRDCCMDGQGCGCWSYGGLDMIEFICFDGDLDVIKWLHFNKKYDFHNNREVKPLYYREISKSEDSYPSWRVIRPSTSGPEGEPDGDFFFVALASARGHLDVVEWLHQNIRDITIVYALDRACVNGHLNIIKWFHKNYEREFTDRKVVRVAEHGHLKALKWFNKNYQSKVESSITETIGAVAEGNNPFEIGSRSSNHLEILKWIKHNYPNAKCPGDVLGRSFAGRNLEIVKWIHYNTDATYTYECIKHAEYLSKFARHASSMLNERSQREYTEIIDFVREHCRRQPRASRDTRWSLPEYVRFV